MAEYPITTNASDASALLSVGDVAELLKCSARTVYRLADAGRIPRPVKLGALVRWRAGELSQWIADGCLPCRTRKAGAR
ncbi:MAG: helix-turn-helix domain-containing protein [Phycisphaerales bacterium]|nr:helix-turn-helix domain-containing protein [Phycisphaerales bacterium]